MNIWFLYKGAQTTLILVEIRYLMLQHTYLSSLVLKVMLFLTIILIFRF